MELATQKQLDYLKVLGASEKDLIGLNIKEASIMIHKLKKGVVERPEIKPEHSLRVGDILVMSWGYDQTNLNFFQVVKVCGKSSVRVVEVCLPVISESEEYYCSMSRDAKFDKKGAKKLAESHFINDQENGDLKKVKNWYEDKREDGDHVVIFNYNGAYKYNGEKLYESWYA